MVTRSDAEECMPEQCWIQTFPFIFNFTASGERYGVPGKFTFSNHYEIQNFNSFARGGGNLMLRNKAPPHPFPRATLWIHHWCGTTEWHSTPFSRSKMTLFHINGRITWGKFTELSFWFSRLWYQFEVSPVCWPYKVLLFYIEIRYSGMRQVVFWSAIPWASVPNWPQRVRDEPACG